MDPLFSTSISEMTAHSSMAAIQILADQELMGLWEQTQLAAAALEKHGGSASAAHRYERAVLLEMQKRIVCLPEGKVFGQSASEDAALSGSDAMPHIMVLR